MFPMFQPEQWASIKIGFAMFSLGVFAIKFMTGSKYEEKIIEPAPMPSTDFLNMAAKYSASQAIANLDIDKDVALDYAYAHNDKTAMTGPLPGSF